MVQQVFALRVPIGKDVILAHYPHFCLGHVPQRILLKSLTLRVNFQEIGAQSLRCLIKRNFNRLTLFKTLLDRVFVEHDSRIRFKRLGKIQYSGLISND